MRITSAGDVGIGTSSPAERLQVNGTIKSLATANWSILSAEATDGTRSAVSQYIPFGTQTSTNPVWQVGHRFSANGNLAFWRYNGSSHLTNDMTLDASGNLGLGVTPSAWGSPFKAFQGANSSVAFQTNANVMRLTNNNYYNGTAYVYSSNGAASQFNLKETSAFEWQIAASGTAGNAITFTQAMTLDASGNLGIGVTAPAAQLATLGNVNIGNNSSTNPVSYLRFGATQFGAADIRPTDESTHKVGLSFYTDGTADATINPTERMRIDSSGNVGIGTSSPGAKLEVNGSIVTTRTDGGAYIISRGGYSASTVYTFWGNDTTGISNPAAGTLGFLSSGSERMRIDSSGRVLIGRTTTINTSYKLNVDNGNAGSIVANSTGGGDANYFSTSTGIGYHFYAESTTAKFYVVNAGTIYSTNTAVQAISDIRHKENIKDLETGLAEVLALKPRRFDWKEGCGTGEKNVAGFIAQEVEPILPDLIGDWQNQMGSDEKFKSLAMGNMLPTLVKAIQELKAIVDQQSTELDSVKAELQTLKGN